MHRVFAGCVSIVGLLALSSLACAQELDIDWEQVRVFVFVDDAVTSIARQAGEVVERNSDYSLVVVGAGARGRREMDRGNFYRRDGASRWRARTRPGAEISLLSADMAQTPDPTNGTGGADGTDASGSRPGAYNFSHTLQLEHHHQNSCNA